MTNRIIGLVAAAGASRRMGRPKALLRHQGQTFARRLCVALREGGVGRVMLTVPPQGADDVRAAVAGVADECLENVEPEWGLSGSILSVLAWAPDARGIVVCPVDAPFATAQQVGFLVAALEGGASAAVLAAGGVPGHPVAFGRGSFSRLRDAAGHGGPAVVLAALGPCAVVVECADGRVLANIDTPEAYARWCEPDAGPKAAVGGETSNQ